MAEYNRINLEGEIVGLPPLDICTEKYYFDEGWAKDDPEWKGMGLEILQHWA